MAGCDWWWALIGNKLVWEPGTVTASGVLQCLLDRPQSLFLAPGHALSQGRSVLVRSGLAWRWN
eukprot:365291-Chlamydomonas_euryale.AAC.1